MEYYAHSSPELPESEWQLLLSHLESTGWQAGQFASKFNAEGLGKAAGYLHDLGKYSQEFQYRIRGGSLKVDHSTAGAQEAIAVYGRALGMVLAYCIAGHHAGLPDYGSLADTDSLCSRLDKTVSGYDNYKTEMLPKPCVLSQVSVCSSL